MDPAAMRPSSFNVEFCYTGPTWLSALYGSLLAPLVERKSHADLMGKLYRQKALVPGEPCRAFTVPPLAKGEL